MCCYYYYYYNYCYMRIKRSIWHLTKSRTSVELIEKIIYNFFFLLLLLVFFSSVRRSWERLEILLDPFCAIAWRIVIFKMPSNWNVCGWIRSILELLYFLPSSYHSRNSFRFRLKSQIDFIFSLSPLKIWGFYADFTFDLQRITV